MYLKKIECYMFFAFADFVDRRCLQKEGEGVIAKENLMKLQTR